MKYVWTGLAIVSFLGCHQIEDNSGQETAVKPSGAGQVSMESTPPQNVGSSAAKDPGPEMQAGGAHSMDVPIEMPTEPNPDDQSDPGQMNSENMPDGMSAMGAPVIMGGPQRIAEKISAKMGLFDVQTAVFWPESSDDQDDAVEALLDGIDCLLMPGGADIDPAIYGEEPHESVNIIPRRVTDIHFALIEGAIRRRMPILGLCLGAQEINVFLGGSLVQDIPTEIPEYLSHFGDHAIDIVPNTLMSELYGERVDVSSSHHQAVDPNGGLGEGLTISARSSDGVVEAIEATDRTRFPFLLGTQYHPENDIDNPVHDPLWQTFARACFEYRRLNPNRQFLTPTYENLAVCDSEGASGLCLEDERCAGLSGVSGDSCGEAGDVCCTEIACESPEGPGHCMAQNACESSGGVTLDGECPGSDVIGCCVRHIECTLNDASSGICQSTSVCDNAGGRREAGHCPGPAHIQCCVAND